MKKQICCICGEEFEGFGNNPWPIVKDPGKRCCDKCNISEVIPARMKRARKTDKLLKGEVL